MSPDEILALISSAPNGLINRSELFAGKHSQRAQLTVVNTLATMRREGTIKIVKQDGETFYQLGTSNPATVPVQKSKAKSE